MYDLILRGKASPEALKRHGSGSSLTFFRKEDRSHHSLSPSQYVQDRLACIEHDILLACRSERSEAVLRELGKAIRIPDADFSGETLL